MDCIFQTTSKDDMVVNGLTREHIKEIGLKESFPAIQAKPYQRNEPEPLLVSFRQVLNQGLHADLDINIFRDGSPAFAKIVNIFF